jgi:hypothetical protein
MTTTTMLNYDVDRYYRHTGRAPIVGTTIATIAAWVVVSLIGVAYAYVQLHVKIVDLLSFLFVAAFAAAMAVSVYGVLRWAKVRNMAVTALVAISAALLGWYVSWVAWEHALLRQGGMQASAIRLAEHPDAVWYLAKSINEEGTFSIRKRTVKGTELWVAWAIEALVFIGATIAIPVMKLRDLAFCESCGRWCTKTDGVVRVGLGDEAMLRQQLEAKDFSHFRAAGPIDPDMPHWRADLYRCPGCPDTHLLTISRVTISYYNNQRQEKATKVIDRLWVDAAQAAEVRDASQAWEGVLRTKPGAAEPQSDVQNEAGPGQVS